MSGQLTLFVDGYFANPFESMAIAEYLEDTFPEHPPPNGAAIPLCSALSL